MPISIQCPQCNRAYRVNDKLAGQKVRCRDCGTAIDIPGDLPELPADAEPKSKIPGVPDLRSLFGAATHKQQRPAAASQDINIIDPPDTSVRRRRWVRKPDHPLLESIDELIKAVGPLVIIGSIIVWVIHIYKTSPLGLSFGTLAPMAVVLLVIAGVFAPIVSIAINAAVKIVKLPPRNDSYMRTVIPFLLPFAAQMLAAWPGAADKLTIIPQLAWAISPVLFIYLFRAEIFEWAVSIGAAAAGVGVSFIATSIVIAIITSMTGALYKDMLPPGIWLGLAQGHSPPPELATRPAAVAETTPAVPATAPEQPVQPVAEQPVAQAPLPQLAINSTGENHTAPLAPQPKHLTPTPSPTPGPATGPAPSLSPDLQSAFLTGVISDQPGLSDVSHVLVAPTPNGTMLVVKNSDTESAVEKWDVNPPAKKGDAVFPFFPKKPNEFLLGPKGDFLVTLGYFPRNELIISTFNNKIPRKNVPVEGANAVPSLVGFYDPGHFYIRWDEGASPHGMAKLQQWTASSAQPGRMTSAIAAAPPESAIAVSPGSRTLAVFEPSGQLTIYSMESGAVQRKIKPSDLAFNFINMAYSPDGNEIAVYGLVADVPTISSFKVAQGTPVATAVLAPSFTRPRDDTMKHRLIWFQDSQGEDLWLANGNELLDATTGRKIGALDLQGVLDQQLTSSNSLVFELPGDRPGCEKLVLARWNDAALHEAKVKAE